jgi:hypothetical protein
MRHGLEPTTMGRSRFDCLIHMMFDTCLLKLTFKTCQYIFYLFYFFLWLRICGPGTRTGRRSSIWWQLDQAHWERNKNLDRFKIKLFCWNCLDFWTITQEWLVVKIWNRCFPEKGDNWIDGKNSNLIDSSGTILQKLKDAGLARK